MAPVGYTSVMPVKQTRYITALEAAAIMGMNARYVRRLCATDKLACDRFGKVYMVLRTAAEAYVRDPYGRGRPSAAKKESTIGKGSPAANGSQKSS